MDPLKRSRNLNYLIRQLFGTSVFLASVSDKFFFLICLLFSHTTYPVLFNVSRIVQWSNIFSATVGIILVASGIGFWTSNTILPTPLHYRFNLIKALVQSADEFLEG